MKYIFYYSHKHFVLYPVGFVWQVALPEEHVVNSWSQAFGWRGVHNVYTHKKENLNPHPPAGDQNLRLPNQDNTYLVKFRSTKTPIPPDTPSKKWFACWKGGAAPLREFGCSADHDHKTKKTMEMASRRHSTANEIAPHTDGVQNIHDRKLPQNDGPNPMAEIHCMQTSPTLEIRDNRTIDSCLVTTCWCCFWTARCVSCKWLDFAFHHRTLVLI